jgi:hypothetical protein
MHFGKRGLQLKNRGLAFKAHQLLSFFESVTHPGREGYYHKMFLFYFFKKKKPHLHLWWITRMNGGGERAISKKEPLN